MFKRLVNFLLKPVRRWPVASFFVALGLLILLVAVSNFWRNSKIQTLPDQAESSKAVNTYKISKSALVKVQGEVEKSGVTTVISQTNGVVYRIAVKEGQTVHRGDQLIKLSSTALGASVATIQRQLAQKQYENLIDTYDVQIDLNEKQKRLAELADQNSDELRNLANKSAEDTRGVIDLNENIISKINDNLQSLKQNNVNGSNDELIFQTEQLQAQYSSGLSQLQSALRNSEYQASDDMPPADLADVQRELTTKQLDLQRQALDLSKELSHLNLRLAQIGEAMMSPTAPVSGTVEYVYVKKNQVVTPGTSLVLISGDEGQVQVKAFVGDNLVKQVSRLFPSKLYIDDVEYETMPDWISNEPVSNQLFSIIYNLPAKFSKSVTNGDYVSIDLPIEINQSGLTENQFLVPLDAVFQTQTQSFVLVIKDDRALSKEVSLGKIVGSYVYVTSGLDANDVVITDRTVTAGDLVTAQ